MLDRVKEAVFSILGGKFEGQRVLDSFAGTGSLGLEALSRGAKHCTFLESDPKAIVVVERNIEKLKVEDRARVLKWDALSWNPRGEEKFDLFFFDPPYKFLQGTALLRQKTVSRFANLFHDLGSEKAQGVFHYPLDLLDLSELAAIPNLDIREYGTSAIAIGRNST